MNILVTGANGQLGHEMQICAQKSNHKFVFTDVAEGYEKLDITNLDAIREKVRENDIQVIVNCAAYTNVDKAETDYDLANLLNNTAAGNLAQAMKEVDGTLIHVSTDYVFQGDKNIPCREDWETNPLGVYGKTKLAGELAVKSILDKYFIVRISWVFGINGNNFIKTMLKLGKERSELNIVADQIGSPTYTADLAPLLCDMVATDKYGTYHATNEGVCSWAEFAEEIFKIAKIDCKVNHITSEEYPTKAVRPENSRMSKQSLEAAGFNRLPSWRSAVEKYLNQSN